MGYAQPPSYHVFKLPVSEGGRVTDEGPARLRPNLEWLDNRGIWKWAENPFVGSQEYRGLLVLMMVLNSTDLKDDNNALYLARRPGTRATLWYTVKDLGATFGETGRFSRNGATSTRSKSRVSSSQARGHSSNSLFKGRHGHLLKNIRGGDVQWTCTRLQRISDAQLRDAFRAGGFSPETSAKFVAKIRDKVREGLALEPMRQAS